MVLNASLMVCLVFFYETQFITGLFGQDYVCIDTIPAFYWYTFCLVFGNLSLLLCCMFEHDCLNTCWSGCHMHLFDIFVLIQRN